MKGNESQMGKRLVREVKFDVKSYHGTIFWVQFFFRRHRQESLHEMFKRKIRPHLDLLSSLKKNLNAPRPSEHPPVWGKKSQNV